MTRITALVPLAVALAAGAAHAQALRPPGAEAPIARSVAYADLDLNREADVRILERRLRSASADACREATADEPGVASYAVYGRCLDASMDAAVRRINAPLLAALVAGRPAAEGKLRVASR